MVNMRIVCVCEHQVCREDLGLECMFLLAYAVYMYTHINKLARARAHTHTHTLSLSHTLTHTRLMFPAAPVHVNMRMCVHIYK